MVNDQLTIKIATFNTDKRLKYDKFRSFRDKGQVSLTDTPAV